MAFTTSVWVATTAMTLLVAVVVFDPTEPAPVSAYSVAFAAVPPLAPNDTL